MRIRHWYILLALALVAVAFAGPVVAQDADGADQAGEPEPIQGKVGVIEEGETPTSSDPADQVVEHIVAMTTIVRGDMDAPDEVKTKLKAYIDENGAAMEEAGKAFEARLDELPTDERQAYKEKLQRKMETALADFFEVMLDFSERHPEAAKELDEMLQKVQ